MAVRLTRFHLRGDLIGWPTGLRNLAQNARSLECARYRGTSGGVLEISRVVGYGERASSSRFQKFEELLDERDLARREGPRSHIPQLRYRDASKSKSCGVTNLQVSSRFCAVWRRDRSSNPLSPGSHCKRSSSTSAIPPPMVA